MCGTLARVTTVLRSGRRERRCWRWRKYYIKADALDEGAVTLVVDPAKAFERDDFRTRRRRLRGQEGARRKTSKELTMLSDESLSKTVHEARSETVPEHGKGERRAEAGSCKDLWRHSAEHTSVGTMGV